MDVMYTLQYLLTYILELFSYTTSMQVRTLQVMDEIKRELHNKNATSNNIHDIKCDNCQREFIIGIRYKCLICDEFNICEDCEKIDKLSYYSQNFIHDDTHNFIKVKNTSAFNHKMSCQQSLIGNKFKRVT